MKRNIMILMLITAITAPCFANTNAVSDTVDIYQWDRLEKALFGLHIITSSIDFMQAYTVFKHDNIKELNLVANALGPKWLPLHYVGVRLVGTWWAIDGIPSGKWRKTALIAINAINVFAVVHNSHVFKRAGIRY